MGETPVGTVAAGWAIFYTTRPRRGANYSIDRKSRCDLVVVEQAPITNLRDVDPTAPSVVRSSARGNMRGKRIRRKETPPASCIGRRRIGRAIRGDQRRLRRHELSPSRDRSASQVLLVNPVLLVHVGAHGSDPSVDVIAVGMLCHLSEGEMSRADPSVAVSTQHWEVGLQTRSIATRCVALRFAGCVASSSLRRVRARHVFLVLVAISKPIG